MREIILEKLFCLAILSEFVSDLRPQLVSEYSIYDQESSLPTLSEYVPSSGLAQNKSYHIGKGTKRKSKF